MGGGLIAAYLSLLVLIPLAAVASRATDHGLGAFWDSVSSREAVACLKLTVGLAVAVVVVNAVMGTLIAWVLVRDDFRGRALLGGVIDLPFALPTIVAGIVLLTLYGPKGPLGINVAYTRIGILLALLFVTLPFVVRAVEPVLRALDPEMEEAAASLGASPFRIFRSVVLPNLRPAIASGSALAFARAIGEFGSVVLIAGNLPFKTETAPVFIFGRIESNDIQGAAAVSLVLLVGSLAVLAAIQYLGRRGTER